MSVYTHCLGGIMAEVLAGLGSLFGGAATSATPTMMGTGLLQPDILKQTAELTGASKKENPIFSAPTNALLTSVNQNAQQNLKNAMPMMQLNPMQQQAQIQQTNLMDLLRSIGGGY